MLILVLANSAGRQKRCFNSRLCVYVKPAEARSWGGAGDVLMTASYGWLTDSVCLTSAAESRCYLCFFGQTTSNFLPGWVSGPRQALSHRTWMHTVCVRPDTKKQAVRRRGTIHPLPSPDGKRHCSITKKCSLHGCFWVGTAAFQEAVRRGPLSSPFIHGSPASLGREGEMGLPPEPGGLTPPQRLQQAEL